AIGAPKNTPVEIVDMLNKEINAGLVDPKMRARLADLGGRVFVSTPAEFEKLFAEESEKWGKVVRFAGIKPEGLGNFGQNLHSTCSRIPNMNDRGGWIICDRAGPGRKSFCVRFGCRGRRRHATRASFSAPSFKLNSRVALPPRMLRL